MVNVFRTILCVALLPLASFSWAERGDHICEESFLLEASPQELQAELDSGADPNTICDELPIDWWYGIFDAPVLHYFAHIDQAESVELLLKRGAAPNSVDEDRLHTALSWSSLNLCIKVMSLLISAGADPNMGEEAPIFMALLGKSHLFSKSCTSVGTRKEALLFLLQNGADPNYSDRSGNRPLHYAVTEPGTKALVLILIGAGARVNVANNKGETPLMLAKRYGLTDTVDVLIQAGAVDRME